MAQTTIKIEFTLDIEVPKDCNTEEYLNIPEVLVNNHGILYNELASGMRNEDIDKVIEMYNYKVEETV